MSVFRKLSGGALALALLASLAPERAAGGGATAADRLQHGGAAAAHAPAFLLAQAERGMNRVPSVFQGMMIPEIQRRRDCRSADEIHDRLKRQGWWDFGNLERKGKYFTVRARRPNGSSYQLTIDGCSGRVLDAMRLNSGQRGFRLWPR